MPSALKQFRKPQSLSVTHFRALEHLPPQGYPHPEAIPVAGVELPIPKKRLFFLYIYFFFLNKNRSGLFFSWYFPTFPNSDALRGYTRASLRAQGRDRGGWRQRELRRTQSPRKSPPATAPVMFSPSKGLCEDAVFWKLSLLFLDGSCLQRIGAEMILFSMLLSILLQITPSVQASECKWIYQFLKYKLKKIGTWY